MKANPSFFIFIEMGKVKKRFFIQYHIVLIPGIVSMLLLNGCSQEHKIEIIKEESFYSDFTVEDDKVYIQCELTMNKTTNREQKVGFFAYFPDDVGLG